jgi:hypothetical protein
MKKKGQSRLFERHLTQHPLTLKAERTPFPRARERAAWEALPRDTREGLLRWGGEALQGYPARPATAFLAFTRTGDRLADEEPYFKRRSLLMGAALAECAEHQGRYLDAVIDGLWCVCEETSWVISAHNDGHPLPDPENPSIDLFAAQTAATVSYTLYLLEDELNAVSPWIVRRARRELGARVIRPFLKRDDFWWMGVVRKNLNNWTPWICSNVIDTLLLTPLDEPVVLEGLARAMRILDRYLAVLPADGGCDEGAAYWNMAGGSLLDCLENLRFAAGLDLYADPLIRAVGAFPLRAHIADGWFWNFADCDAKPALDAERIYTYGLRTENPALAALGARLFAGYCAFPPRDTPQMNRVLQALFTVVPAPSDALESTDRTVILPDLQAFAFERGGLYAAIKGGHNAESHNHNDVGSFLLSLGGEPAVVDAGNMTYTAKTFGPERYTLWNTRSRNHNLPLIGGLEQRPGAQARAADVKTFENGVSMELAAAWPPEAGLRSFRRALTNDGTVTLTDTLALDSPREVQWVFLLRQKPAASEPGVLRAGLLTLRYDPSLAYACEEVPVTDARMARSFPGSLWRVMLTAVPVTEHRRVFRFTRS